MKTSPRRRKHRRRAFRRLFWLLVLATLLLLLWPRRVTLDGLNSPHAILLRADSGEVLAEKDADSTIYPASMTKMMTALLAIEANPDLDTPVTLPEEIFPALQAQNASLAGFQAGETATVRDLLYGAMLPSGAECCEALAREVSGSEEAFVARMNQKAAELGMTGTHFCNPTGLHAPEHVSTVRDMARLTEAALQNETFRKLFTTERYTVPATNCHPQGFTMHSTLLSQLDGTELHSGRILGGKTGYTGEAGLCLASLAEVNVGSMVAYLGSQNETVVYLDPECDDATAAQVGETLSAMPGVSGVQYVSKQDVLDTYRGYMQDYSSLWDEFETDNPFKANYRVTLSDLTQMERMSVKMQAIPGVVSVTAPVEMTNVFVEIQKAVTKGGRMIVMVLMVVSIITVGSTIRLSVFARRREIEIMKYVGATNRMVTLPFFVEGLTMGLISGILTAAVSLGCYSYVVNAAGGLGGIWQMLMGRALVPVANVLPTIVVTSLLSGAIVGGVGSMFSIRKHLNV